MQIGKMEDSGYGTEDFQLVADCLKEYMESFQDRNPNFYVFNAVLHMDEATPHLHIDYIPDRHYKRGQDTQNGIAQALKEMSFGEGKQAIARWRAAEVEVLNKNCLEHASKPLAPEKARGTLEAEEYKEQRRQADELAEQNAQVKAELGEKREMLKAVKEKTAKLAEIDSIETGKTVFGGKVTVSQEDWQNITDLAKKEVASQKQTKKLRKERDEAVRERDELKAKLSAVSSELATYKKAEEQKGLFTREKLKKEAKRISREDELSRELRKAKAFISACGLSSDFQQYKYNSTTRKNVLIAQLVNFLSELIEANDPEQVSKVKSDAVEMLTVKECTEAVKGLSEHTVRKLIKQGKLPYLRTGDGVNGKMLINKADLLAYFNGQTTNK